ncbi:hypothetical protein HELRODRAFT_165013 [Helobdella robusta]|uniref:Uncharacterized protein n=1 Tax=Helobdella robusta TaxID=6412 RepID=T1EW48_HELRO|nr:hypothetical protein HELRODRAFT_165013 [Helobdella robusta]ESN92882.1 hypothetical protein HELRODRAFT_165013 [Helobdella robusta]
MQQSQENSMVNSINSRGKVKNKKKKIFLSKLEGSRSREQVVDDIELIILVSSKRFIGVKSEKDSVVLSGQGVLSIPEKYAKAEECCRKIQNGPSMVLRLGTLSIGSMTGRSMENAEMLE